MSRRPQPQRPRPPTAPPDEAPAPADAARLAAAPAVARGRRASSRSTRSGKTVYQSFTDQEFLAARADASGSGSRTTRTCGTTRSSATRSGLTVKFTLITVSFEFVLGLVIALVVNSSFKGRGVMRAVMLVPWAIPTVVAAQMWKWMLDDIFGVVNDAGVRLHLLSTLARLDLRPEHGARRGLRRRHLEDDAVRRPAPARRAAGDPEGPLRGRATSTARAQLQQFWQITLPLLRPAILVTLIFRTLDALRVFDVFYVFFGNRPDTQTMAIYAQNTIVGDGHVGYGAAISVAIFLIIALFVVIYVTFMRVKRGMTTAAEAARTERPRQPAQRPVRKPLRPRPGQAARSTSWSPRSSSTRCSRSTGRSARRSRPTTSSSPRRSSTSRQHPTLDNFREVLSSGVLPARAAQLDDRRRLGDAALAGDRLARRLRARTLPLPRPLVRDVPDALDDDLPADRDPRRALHDDQRLRASTTRWRADLHLPDLHAAVHGLGADELHARALPRDLEEAAYVDGATPLQVFYKVLLPLIAPGPRHDGPAGLHRGLERVPLRALVHPDARQLHGPGRDHVLRRQDGSAFQMPWGQIMAATVDRHAAADRRRR